MSPEITDAESYKAYLVAQAQDVVARVEGKVARARADVDAALDALSEAHAELERVRASTPVWVEPR